MFEREITFDRFIRGLIIAVGLLLFFFIVRRLSSVLLPFFVAWLLAYMIYPMVTFFQYKLRMRSRMLSILASLLIILAALTGFFYLVVPPAISEFVRFRDVIADFFLANGNTNLSLSLENYFKRNIDQNTLVQLLHENNIMEALKEALNRLWSLMSYTLDFIVSIIVFFLVLLYLFFILMDYERISENWIKLIPKRNRKYAKILVNDVQQGMNSYFRGQALVAFCVGVLFSLGFLIIDYPLAIALGMFIGFLNLVPYLQAVGFVPTVLLAILKAYDTGENFWFILLSACAVFLIVQCIQDIFLVPKIMGKIMGLRPAVILLSLSIWGFLLGMIGLIIALPLTTLLLSYYRRFIERDERRCLVEEQWKYRKLLKQQTNKETTSQTISKENLRENDLTD